MRFGKVFKALGPVITLAVAGGLAACDNANIRINDSEGVPLSELDLSGDPPREVVLVGPDNLDIRTGETLAIEVEGSDEIKQRLRFVRDGSTLAIMRAKGESSRDTATVIVTMPSPSKLTVGGSGTITAAELTGDAEAHVLGSGSLIVAGIAADTLSVTIAGSGSMRGGGKTGALELDVLGSGNAELGRLSAGKADVTIAGSGSATFASDGEIDAEILGSGSVTVRGEARCRVRTVGSGALVCERNAEPVD